MIITVIAGIIPVLLDFVLCSFLFLLFIKGEVFFRPYVVLSF